MKNHKVTEHIEKTDEELIKLYEDLNSLERTSQEYDVITNRIADLTNIREDLLSNRGIEKFKGIDVNTLVTGGISVFSVLLVLNYEKAEIVTSKAMGMATKWIGK